MPIKSIRRLYQAKSCFDKTVVAATTTWDPAHTDAQTTLSSGNLTATTASGSFSPSGFRSIASHSTGKFYSEHLIVVDSSFPTFIAIGIINAARSLTDGMAGTNSGGQSIGLTGDGAVTWDESGATIGTGPAFVQGNTIGQFVNFTDQEISWNLDGGAFSTPVSFAGIIANVPFFAAMYQLVYVATAQQSTTNFGPSFTYTPPVGSTVW